MRPPAEFNNEPDKRYSVRFGIEDPDRFETIRSITRLGEAKAVAMAVQKLHRLHPGARIVLVDVLTVEDEFELDPYSDVLDITSGYVI